MVTILKGSAFSDEYTVYMYIKGICKGQFL